MARPRLELGTAGNIRVKRLGKDSWLADAWFREVNGHYSRPRRTRKTKTEAENALKAALRDREYQPGGSLSGGSRFAEAAAKWMEEIEYTRKATTADTYRRNLERRVLPAFGALSLHECDDVTLVHTWLRSLQRDAKLSANSTRSCRTVLSGVLAFSAQRGAIRRNPVRDAGRVQGGPLKPRALTAEERVDFLARLDEDERARKADLPDLVRYMLATGVRLGEVLGLRWCRVDLEQGIVVHGDNLATVQGRGLVLQTPKTKSSFRVLPLADFALDMLRFRYPGPHLPYNPVFPNVLGTWRSRHNVCHHLRMFRQRAGYDWVTTHTFRRTAITIMDQQGLTPRAIAGYVGHSRPSITMDSYMDRQVQDRDASEALDAAMRVRGTR